MRFYTNSHPYYCGIDLHARTLYVCILNQAGEKVVHREIKADPQALLGLLEPYIGNVIVGVECMHCWYWVSDICEDNGIDFILGHALYMKAIHGGKAKNDKIDSYKIAMLMRGGTFPLAYVYPKEMRATRDLLRRRCKLVRFGADLKAHVKNTLSQYNEAPHNLNLRYPKAREKMRDVLTHLSRHEVKPSRSIYETDDSLILVNASVIEGISVGCAFIPREAARNCPMARPLSFNGI